MGYTMVFAQYTAFNDIFFLNRDHGWIAGWTYIPDDPPGKGLVLLTTDGGINWEEILINHSKIGGLQLEKIYFLNENIGWALSRCGILKTINGGKNWFFQADSIIYYNLYDIYFINENIGWASGIFPFFEHQAAIYKTTDGGDTWEVRAFDNMHDPFYKITFIDSLDGWAVGGGLHQSGAYVFHTNDGGDTWEGSVYYGYEPLYDAAYMNRNNFWAVGNHVGFGRIIYTSDGENWVNQYSSYIPGFYPLFSIDFTDSLNGWAAGYEVVRTIDGGNNWGVVTDSIQLKALAAIDTSEAWGLSRTTSVLHTVDGGLSWQPVTPTSVDQISLSSLSFHLYQNYPNPFNSFTFINYQLSYRGEVSLKIYNLTGKEVRTLVNQIQARGVHQLTWNGKDNSGNEVSSGMYFLKLRFEPYSQNKKMLLTR